MGHFDGGFQHAGRGSGKTSEINSPHLDPVSYISKEKLAKSHVASGRGRSIVHCSKMPSLILTLAGGEVQA